MFPLKQKEQIMALLKKNKNIDKLSIALNRNNSENIEYYERLIQDKEITSKVHLILVDDYYD